MNRREVLTTLGVAGTVGLAGCGETVTSALSGDTPYPEGPQRRVMVAEQDTVPAEYGLHMEIEMRQSRITHAQTAHLRLTATNEGHARGISFSDQKCALFNRQKGWSDNPRGLALHNPTATEYIDRKENQWVRDMPPDKSVGFDGYGCGVSTFESGATLTNEYLLWDDYRIEGYLEPGTYRWEEDIELTEVPPQPDGPDTLATFGWGFSLTVERLEG